jgi:hypothetical protein
MQEKKLEWTGSFLIKILVKHSSLLHQINNYKRRCFIVQAQRTIEASGLYYKPFYKSK